VLPLPISVAAAPTSGETHKSLLGIETRSFFNEFPQCLRGETHKSLLGIETENNFCFAVTFGGETHKSLLGIETIRIVGGGVTASAGKLINPY